MSDADHDGAPRVIDLATERARRAEAMPPPPPPPPSPSAPATEAEFAFVRRDDLGDADAPVGSTPEGLVCFVLEGVNGVEMSPEAARRFGVALIECAFLATQSTKARR